VDPRIPADVEWRRSSFSHTDDESVGWVEVALLADGEVALRDSRDPDGQVHVYTPAEWAAFVKGVHAGEFDGP
jgi:hypothetical protein